MHQHIEKGWSRRWRNILDKTHRVGTYSELQELLTALSAPVTPQMLAFVNAHAMNLIAESISFYEAIHSADILLRDGSGMATLFRLLAQSPGVNLNGTDMIPAIISRYDGRTIALLGSLDPYLHNAVARVGHVLAPQSEVLRANGFLEAATYLALVLERRPALIILGMGMPKQEQVATLLRRTLPFPCLIVCGGAIIDFLGAKVPRAPILMRKVGLEWLYRLALEPRRLFLRYVVGNPQFVLRALKFAFVTKQ